jgi:tetratricopeptide (TPR) repeat protein
MTSNALAETRLERLSHFLKHDPANLSLLADTAFAAYEAGGLDQATSLLERHAVIAPLPLGLINLQGLIAIRQNRCADAVAIFAHLRAGGENNPVLRFNLAWCHAVLNEYREALDLLDEDTLSASPRAPSLRIEMLHHLQLYDKALDEGAGLTKRFPEDQALMGALATLAMDAGKLDVARQYAGQAGTNPEGQAALGMIALGDRNTDASLGLFENALAQQPDNARAWIGKGLTMLMSGDIGSATKALDKGAELFGDHLGSWIASGWAHFMGGDYVGARASFERAMAADPNFAETHGGLAVLDVVEGHVDEARRHTEIALRLDRKSFGAALAKSMILERGGHAQMAQKIRDIALSQPVGPNGETIAEALVSFGSRLRK